MTTTTVRTSTVQSLASHHATSTEVLDDILRCVTFEGETICDNTAAAIASWWCGPRSHGLTMLALAQRQTVTLDALAAAIDDAIGEALGDPYAIRELEHLAIWAEMRAR